MPLPENIFILFYWTAPEAGAFSSKMKYICRYTAEGFPAQHGMKACTLHRQAFPRFQFTLLFSMYGPH